MIRSLSVVAFSAGLLFHVQQVDADEYRSSAVGDILVKPAAEFAPVQTLVEPLLGPGEVVAWAATVDRERKAGPLGVRKRADFVNHAVLSAGLAFQAVQPDLWYIHPNKPALVQGVHVPGSAKAPFLLVPGSLKQALAWFASHYGYSLLWDTRLDADAPSLVELFEASGESLPLDLKRLQKALGARFSYLELHNDDSTNTIYANRSTKGFAQGEHLLYVDDYDLF